MRRLTLFLSGCLSKANFLKATRISFVVAVLETPKRLYNSSLLAFRLQKTETLPNRNTINKSKYDLVSKRIGLNNYLASLLTPNSLCDGFSK